MIKHITVICSPKSVITTMNDFIFHNDKTLTKVVRKSRIVYTDTMIIKFRTRANPDDQNVTVMNEQEFIKEYCDKSKKRRDKNGYKHKRFRPG